MARELSYSVTDLPAVWPGVRTKHPRRAPFKTQWTRTLGILARELAHLGARKVEIALELPRGAHDLRQDGGLRADARPRPAVILSFLDRDGQRQAYPCDTFLWWEDNLYAIAVVLEDLRRAERYGVQSALLRAGFKSLPSSGTTTMNTKQAAEEIANASPYSMAYIMESAENAKTAIRAAVFATHPDRTGGVRTMYDRVDAARAVLSTHYGVSL